MRARIEDVSWRKVDHQVVILDLRDSNFLRTNAVGALLWERMQSECTLEELAAVLVDSFRIDLDTAMRDSQNFVDMVVANDLMLAT